MLRPPPALAARARWTVGRARWLTGERLPSAPVVHTDQGRLPPDLLVAASLGHAAPPPASQQQLGQELERRGLLCHPIARQVFAALDRASFTSADARQYAYEDRPLPIGCGAVISAPSSHARLLDLAADFVSRRAGAGTAERDDVFRVLDVGSGSGYLSAALALVCHTHWQNTEVVGMDVQPDLVGASRASIRAAGVDMMSRAALIGDLVRGEWAQRLITPGASLRMITADGLASNELGVHGLFDLIVCGGASGAPPESLVESLRPGGRMIIALGNGPLQRLALVDRSSSASCATDVEDTRSKVEVTLLESVVYARLASAPEVGDHPAAPAVTREDLASVQAKLQNWQALFKETHGRKPSRADMEGDSQAASLLASFRHISQRLRSPA